ncbi:major facilitator superfamily transporter [Colletotrichum higginsianum]|uniref:Molybdate-anion transporter n=2 Tax=Colletotrichum higginsianum TaxID=80884 RepID=H1V126_COLHI|nr:Major facilitator superfamily transporter [Colletotrichum higginsianum IMI 349063]OBR02867.1 Major facilitator superfamily transporter [Colletotrichum higginsianum IMI 349063]TID07323.1 Molybdate-anion transporter [Colletotrichum higginsianum]CCF33927.1 major facilitator superfamily transporter [Colletotrichum higginsianum]
MLDIYQLNLAGLLLACGALFASGRQEKQNVAGKDVKKDAKQKQKRQGSQWAFYVVYALVMGSDWLQGPFLYSLYTNEHQISSDLVPSLFTTGFVSGAVAGYFIGSLADRHGRKVSCLFFCAAYALSCILTTIPNVTLLFLGRVLGGLGTSLLFSVFESWMVTDFHARRLGDQGLDLSRTFGLMSTVNSVVAIVSGVVSEWLVSATGTRKAPFLTSVVLLIIASSVIASQWDENYGSTGKASPSKASRSKTASLWPTMTDKRVLAIGLASTMFEGSMYLFVVLWSPVLVSASSSPETLPYGIIFASFMASTLLASLLYPRLLALVSTPSRLLLSVLLAANVVFFALGTGAPRAEQITFWLFCLFEACVGLYFPSMGYLKGKVVDDGVRAQVYGVLRIPLNVFVVVSLMFSSDGQAAKVFLVCSMLLQASCGALWLMDGQDA